jgi:DNA-binding HxlR family transcriptional regulator
MTQDGTFFIPGMPNITVLPLANAGSCPIRNVLDHVGSKWSLLVLFALRGGCLRFMELKRTIGDITQRVLTQTLRSLERDGYVIRTVHPTSPPAVEYRLTKMGESLLRPMSGLVAWANQHFGQVVDSRKRYDVRAGTLAK